MGFVTADCNLVLSSVNYLTNAISHRGSVACLGHGRMVQILSVSSEDTYICSDLGVQVCDTPRCFAWGKQAVDIMVQLLCIGDASGSITICAWNEKTGLATCVAKCPLPNKTPVVHVLFIEGFAGLIDGRVAFRIVALTATATYVIHFSHISDHSVSAELPYTSRVLDVGISRPLIAAYNEKNDMLFIVRKTGECVVVLRPSETDADQIYYLPGNADKVSNGFGALLVSGPPIAALFIPSKVDDLKVGICFDEGFLATQVVVEPVSTEESSTRNALISILSSDDKVDKAMVKDMPAVQPKPSQHISKGSFPHALPGQSIMDSLYVPHLPGNAPLTNAEYCIATRGNRFDVVCPSGAQHAKTHLDQTINSTSVLDSLYSISAEGMLLGGEDTKKSKSEISQQNATLRFYSVSQISEDIVRPRVKDCGMLELKSLGVFMEKPDLWAYHALTDSTSSELSGVVAVASTTSALVHILLHKLSGSFSLHMTIDIRQSSSSINAEVVSKGLSFTPTGSLRFSLFVLGARRYDSNSLASAEMERRFQTELFEFPVERFNIPYQEYIWPNVEEEKIETTSFHHITDDTCRNSQIASTVVTSKDLQLLMGTILNLEKRVLRRLDDVEEKLNAQSLQMNDLVRGVNELKSFQSRKK